MRKQVDTVPTYQEQRSELKNRLSRAIAQLESLKLLGTLADMAEAFAKQQCGKREQRQGRFKGGQP